MKRWIAAVALAGALAAGSSTAQADERDNALGHIAQAMAVAKLCSRLETNDGMITVLAVTYGVDFKRDRAELMAKIEDQLAPWRGKDEEGPCVAGLVLYGPDGINVPDLVREK